MSNIEIFGVLYLKKGSGIHIKKKNRGKFTEYCGGKVTDECIQKAKKSGNSKLVKRAVFAQNARGWSKKHKEGGEINNKDLNKDEKPKKPKRDPYFDECELAIRQELGRKATINVNKGNKGTLEIEFFSKEDLQSILETLAKW